MGLYTHYPDLPDLPQNLVNQITEENVRTTINTFEARDGENYEIPWYSLHQPSSAIIDYLSPHFANNMKIKIQLITRELLIHKDKGRAAAFNYIIKSGGENVSTVWFDDDKNEIERVVLPEKQWYFLDLSKFHNIYDITETRIAITIFESVETE